MEQKFEDDINKKNTQSKELGMIIKAINNIYSTCMRNKNAGKKEVHIEDIMEESPDLVAKLIQRLDVSKEVIEDFSQIAKLDIGN